MAPSPAGDPTTEARASHPPANSAPSPTGRFPLRADCALTTPSTCWGRQQPSARPTPPDRQIQRGHRRQSRTLLCSCAPPWQHHRPAGATTFTDRANHPAGHVQRNRRRPPAHSCGLRTQGHYRLLGPRRPSSDSLMCCPNHPPVRFKRRHRTGVRVVRAGCAPMAPSPAGATTITRSE